MNLLGTKQHNSDHEFVPSYLIHIGSQSIVMSVDLFPKAKYLFNTMKNFENYNRRGKLYNNA